MHNSSLVRRDKENEKKIQVLWQQLLLVIWHIANIMMQVLQVLIMREEMAT